MATGIAANNHTHTHTHTHPCVCGNGDGRYRAVGSGTQNAALEPTVEALEVVVVAGT